MKLVRGLALSGLLLVFLGGCATQLTPADRDLMNQAIEASKSATMSAQKAEAEAVAANRSAGRAEAAAVRAEAAADRSALSAAASEASAMKAEKAFEMRLKK